MLLMLLGNAGIVTVVSSLILSFVDAGGMHEWLPRMLALVAGLAVLVAVATSAWVDRHLERVIAWALARWTSLDVHDYASLLRRSALS
jgi:hypothetical protein